MSDAPSSLPQDLDQTLPPKDAYVAQVADTAPLKPADLGPDCTSAPTEIPSATRTLLSVPGHELLGELGRGGMGIVYRARQVRANRDVALKMILSGDYAAASDLARFRAEAEAVARLQHPHIVTVYDVGEFDGRPFFTMEYCPGGSLATKRKGPMAARSAAEMLLKISRGVAAAHAAGVVHRDLKPGNVLLTADGTPKITDFGLAKKIGAATATPGQELTASGAILGTPSYMAPEQAGGARRVGPPADVYALGAILYELLTDRPPFRGATPTDTLLLLLTEEPQSPRELCPTIPRDLEAICLRCLAKEQDRRYPTAAELAEDLTRFLDGEPVSAARSSIVNRLSDSLERVQINERFANYGSLLLALIPVMFVPEVWVSCAAWYDWPGYTLAFGQFGRVAAYLVISGYHRGWRWQPQGAAERHLWMVWIGYLFTCFTFGLSTRLILGFDAAPELKLYPGFACLTGLIFFTMAANFWGYCAVIGAGFLGLAFVMASAPTWAPLEFGTAWSLVLLTIGLRLRKLSRPHDQETQA